MFNLFADGPHLICDGLLLHAPSCLLFFLGYRAVVVVLFQYKWVTAEVVDNFSKQNPGPWESSGLLPWTEMSLVQASMELQVKASQLDDKTRAQSAPRRCTACASDSHHGPLQPTVLSLTHASGTLQQPKDPWVYHPNSSTGIQIVL